MPWFLKSLSETVTDDIELRVCSDQGLNNEGNPLDIIELFIKWNEEPAIASFIQTQEKNVTFICILCFSILPAYMV